MDGVGWDWMGLDGNFEIKFQCVKLVVGIILVRVWRKLIGVARKLAGFFYGRVVLILNLLLCGACLFVVGQEVFNEIGDSVLVELFGGIG